MLLLIACIYCIKSKKNCSWTNLQSTEHGPVIADGAGYYAYLPQWFIYKTEHFEFLPAIAAKYHHNRFGLNPAERTAENRQVNKYYVGTAIANIPFFLIAHFHAGLANADQDGYSWPYLFWINIGSIVYLLFGCVGFYFFFRRWKIYRFWILTGIAGIAFGTDISFYVTHSVPYSHVFSFACIAWLLFCAKKWSDNGSSLAFIWAALFFGLALIIRPTNVLVLLFVPFLPDNLKLFTTRCRNGIKHEKLILAIGVLIVCAFVFFEAWIFYRQTGNWQLKSYSNEGFDNWAHPEILNVLFSWRKGLFIYAPVLLLFFPGLIYLYRNQKNLFFGVVLFFPVATWVIASWWIWWYGGGLGMRPYIDFFAILFIPIVFLLQYARRVFKTTAIVYLFLTCWMYQVYENQMRNHILHYDSISFEQFRTVFMKEDLRYSWYMYFENDSIPADAARLNIPEFFTIAGHSIPPVRTKYDAGTLDDNPKIRLDIRKYVPDSLQLTFGAVFTCDVQIRDPGANPCFRLFFFKNGVQVKEQSSYIGPQIDMAGKWAHVKSMVNSRLICGKDFDTVEIVFLEGPSDLEAKNFTVRFLIF